MKKLQPNKICEDSKTNIYLVVAENIKKYRKQRNLTQEDLAKISGYSDSYIRRIEAPKCQKNFSIQTIYIIASSLNIPIKNLFDDEDIK